MNPDAKQFDLVNATAGVVYSMLAYGRTELPAGAVMLSVPETDTHCLVHELPDCVVIAFRGTDSIRNWITDADFARTLLLQHASGERVEVHAGFDKAWQSIRTTLRTQLYKIVPANPFGPVASKKILILGHSLGGALAKRAALELLQWGYGVAQVYTYGEPRGGNGAFKRLYEAALGDRTWRVVYQEDIVPRIPHLPAFTDPYRHSGPEVFVSSTTLCRTADDLWFNPPVWRLLASDAWGLYRAWTIRKFAAALDPLQDHHINNYLCAMQGICGTN